MGAHLCSVDIITMIICQSVSSNSYLNQNHDTSTAAVWMSYLIIGLLARIFQSICSFHIRYSEYFILVTEIIRTPSQKKGNIHFYFIISFQLITFLSEVFNKPCLLPYGCYAIKTWTILRKKRQSLENEAQGSNPSGYESKCHFSHIHCDIRFFLVRKNDINTLDILDPRASIGCMTLFRVINALSMYLTLSI